MTGTTRATRATWPAATAVLLSAFITGCSSTGTTPAGDGTQAAVPRSSPTAATGEGPSEPTGDGHPEVETPATSSGPLTRRDFPRPRELGTGWAYRVDMGDAEEGYTGNSTPVLERDPTEVAMLAVPFGCPRPVEVPVPAHALEVDYAADGAFVIAVRASFEDPRTASRFFGVRTRLLHGCQGTVASRAEGVLVDQVRELSDTVVLNDRTPDSDPWTELAVHDGDQVVLVAARTRLGGPPLTPDAITDLADAFRR